MTGILQRKIVYIDDEIEIIDLVKLVFDGHYGNYKYEVIGVTRSTEALDKIRQLQPDIIMLDLMMPEMDGWEVYQKLKASEDVRDIPVIVVTAKAHSIDRVLGLHIVGVDHYISKPFGPQDLIDSVERVLQKKAVE